MPTQRLGAFSAGGDQSQKGMHFCCGSNILLGLEFAFLARIL